jgi:hypothetical protein
MATSFLKKHPHLFPVALLILAVLIPYWKLTSMQGVIITDDIFTSDIMNDSFPYRFYLGELLRNWQWPLWYPLIYGGFPMLARAEAGVAYPLNIILFWILPAYMALNAVILLTLITAAVGMYFYCREIETSETGALVAGISFAYSGFMVAHLKHLSTVNAASWFPIGLLLIERGFKQDPSASFMKRARPFILLALVMGIQNLSGHTQTAYYCGLGYAAYFLFKFFVSRRSKHAKHEKKEIAATATPFSRDWRLYGFAVAIVLAIGVSAVQLLPTYELVSLTQRSGGVTFEYASNYAYDPANITTFFYPYARGDIGNATYTGKSIFWEDYGYVGLLTILFALYAAVALWRNGPLVKFLVIGTILSYLLVLGPNTPLYEGVFHVVPGMKFFRFPTRFLLMVDAFVAVLAALGVTHLLNRAGGETKRRAFAFGLVAVVLLDLVYFQMRQNPVADATTWFSNPKTVETIKKDNSLFRIFSPASSESHKMAFSIAQGWEGTLEPYIYQREFIQPSLNVLYGLSSADGYAQLTPSYVVDLWGDQNRGGLIYDLVTVGQGEITPHAPFMKAISMFNVKYVLAPWPLKHPSLKALEAPREVFLYENALVMPRAFVVSGYRIAATPEDAKAVLLQDTFDPTREAIVPHAFDFQSVPTGLAGSATVRTYEPMKVEIEAAANVEGLLILSDTYYPGWRAFVNGEEKEIVKVNFCQRGVELAPGKSHVTFVFDSAPAKTGFGITVGALAVSMLWLFVSRRKK